MSNFDSNSEDKKSPYSSFYSNRSNVESSTNYSNDKFSDNKVEVKSISNNNGYNNFAESESSGYKSSEIDEELEFKSEFFKKAQSDKNILPIEHRRTVDFYDNLMIFSSLSFTSYILYSILKDYPDIKYSKGKVFYSALGWFLVSYYINSNYSYVYEKSYKSLRNKYSLNEVKSMISQYHDTNRKTLEEAYMIEKKLDPKL
jgi:hypothetical protein